MLTETISLTPRQTETEPSPATAAPRIEMTDHALLPQADYIRVGNDLLIRFMGEEQRISDYFSDPQAPQLIGADGVLLFPEQLLARLQLQADAVNVAGPAQGGKLETIGTVSLVVNGPVTAEQPDGSIRELQQGDAIYLYDTLSTADRTYLKVTLIDGTVFQLGPNSRASLNKYAYNASEGDGEFESSVFAGFFRFVSGSIADSNEGQHSTIKTPTATIGIRGSEIDGRVEADGGTTILHMEGLIDVRPHYSFESFAVFEPGTRIYIPPPDSSYSTRSEEAPQEFIFEFRNYLLPLNSGRFEQLLEREPTLPATPLPLAEQARLEAGEPPVMREGPPPPSLMPELPPQAHLFGAERDVLRPELFTPEGGDKVARVLLGEEIRLPLGMAGEDARLAAEDGKLLLRPGGNGDGEAEGLRPPPLEDILGEGKDIADLLPDEIKDVPLPPLPDDVPLDNLRLQVAEDGMIRFPALVGVIGEPVLNPEQLIPPQHGRLLRLESGEFAYQPAPDYNGPDQLAYIVSDDLVINVTIEVLPVNDSPRLLVDGLHLSFNPGDTLSFTEADLLATVYDPDGDPLAVTAVTEDVNSALQMQDGSLLFTPRNELADFARFSYTISDPSGESIEGWASIRINSANQAPVAAGEHFLLPDRLPTQFSHADLLANDQDPEGGALSVSGISQAVGGSVELLADSIVFTPNSDFIRGGFTYQVTDSEGGSATATVLLSLDNAPPVALADGGPLDPNGEIVLGEQGSSLIPASRLLLNDTDIDGDPLTIISVQNPLNGSVVLNADGNVLFSPETGFLLGGGFSYTVSDGRGGEASASVKLTPQANTPPQAANDGGPLDPLGPLTFSAVVAPFSISAARLLANDIDADGDPLSLDSVGQGLNGIASLDADGNVVFRPSAEFAQLGGGFQYTISDSAGASASASVILSSLDPDNRPPVALNDGDPFSLAGLLSTAADTPLLVSAAHLLFNDTDPDGDSLNLSAVSNATNGNALLQADGDVLFTPDNQFGDLGFGSFSYTLSDGRGGSAVAQVQIFRDNQAPVLGPDALRIADGVATILSVDSLLANDVDPDGDTLQLSRVSNPVNGTVALDGAGQIIFTPDALFSSSGVGGFTYTVNDGYLGGQVSAQVSLSKQMPLAADDSFSIPFNEPVVLSSADVLANDPGAGLQITGVQVDDAQWLSANLRGGNIELWVHAETLDVLPGFTYLVMDANGQTGQAHVSLSSSNIQQGTPNADSLSGSIANDILIGDAGNDILTGLAGDDRLQGGDGADILDGGTGWDQLLGEAGDDILLLDPSVGGGLFDGGADNDTLSLTGSGQLLDLISNASLPAEQQYQLLNIEQIDLGAANQLILSLDDVLSVGGGQLIIEGSADSAVTATGGWQSAGTVDLGGVLYNSYTTPDANLLIQQDISTQFVL